MARVIYRKDGSCARSNLRGDFLRIKVERIGAHVGENRNRALVEDTIRRGGKGQRSSDGFVALLEPGGEGRTVQRRSRGAETHGVFSAYPGRECFLELRHFGARGEPIGAQHIGDSLDVIFSNRLSPVRKKRLSDRSSAIDGEQFFGG